MPKTSNPNEYRVNQDLLVNIKKAEIEMIALIRDSMDTLGLIRREITRLDAWLDNYWKPSNEEDK